MTDCFAGTVLVAQNCGKVAVRADMIGLQVDGLAEMVFCIVDHSRFNQRNTKIAVYCCIVWIVLDGTADPINGFAMVAVLIMAKAA